MGPNLSYPMTSRNAMHFLVFISKTPTVLQLPITSMIISNLSYESLVLHINVL